MFVVSAQELIEEVNVNLAELFFRRHVGSPTLSKLTASYGMVSLADQAVLNWHSVPALINPWPLRTARGASFSASCEVMPDTQRQFRIRMGLLPIRVRIIWGAWG